MLAQLTAEVKNSGMRKLKRWAVADDFMPSRNWGRKEAANPKRLTKKQRDAEEQRIANEIRARMAPLVVRANP